MISDDVRTKFLQFFIERQHRRIESAPLVPVGDPTLLFTSAGMVQFKPYFLGEEPAPAPRMTSVQRCFRTTDIDAVGDVSHHTFFEMLGNFSVGDYFKQDAIPWAWQFVTEVLGIPKDRLWNTVYLDDDEAFDLWVAQGQPAARIFRYGEAEGNFWLSGDVGPCGPCSEIFYDWGEEFGCGPACEPAHDCFRFLEIWNLVFMAMYQDQNGARTPLPKPNIDTGAGLERITRVLSGATSTYETDLFTPIVDAITAVIGVRYGGDGENIRLVRAIADHARAVSFLIADGVLPGNEGRGYVVRRLIRKSVYYGRLLGCEGPFLSPVADAVVTRMHHYYPFLSDQRESIKAILLNEERRFGETLEAGLARLDEVISRLDGNRTDIPGDDVFRLHSTYGLPKELTAEIAARQGLSIDERGYAEELERERERSRAEERFRSAGVSADKLALAQSGRGGRFIGYQALTTDTHITGIFLGLSAIARAEAGQAIEVVLRETPFYPEGGGQVGDAGEIQTATGTVLIEDTKRDEGLVFHRGRVTTGTVALNQAAAATVDTQRRLNTTRNHTGTHLLHASLRAVLGNHVRQMGSLVAPDRLRFDYQQSVAPTYDERLAVEHLVNERIREDIPVVTRIMNKEAALGEGVLAFFGDKYGDEVRVVEMAENGHRVSAELCGGTHVDETGQIGLLLLVGDASIGSGIRRVEALTGTAAERYVQHQIALVDRLSRTLGTPPSDLESRVESLMAEVAAARRQFAEGQKTAGRQSAEDLARSAERVGNTGIVAARVDAGSLDALREIGDVLRQRLRSAAIVLGTPVGEKAQFMVMLTSDLLPRLDAREIFRKGLSAAGARGGGKPELAQGGGSSAAMDRALHDAAALVKETLAV